MQFRTHPFRVLAVALALTACAHAQAQTTRQRAGAPPDYGFTWAVIGDPGNTPFEGINGANAGRGGVGYSYRMMTTEVSVFQWLEFVEAYSPFAEDPFARQLTGSFIWPTTTSDGSISYQPLVNFINTPTNASWRMAARYANWLHNDKALTQDAFERGVYDTSTFTRNEDGTYNDQQRRSPGARFWIPSLDEWLKAVYYDPNKGGPGEGGWWMHPNGSDTPLIAAPPEEGGQTNATLIIDTFGVAPYRDVGSYPGVLTPWGLLDASGGMSEWVEDWSTDLPIFRTVRGTSMLTGGLPEIDDRIIANNGGLPTSVSSVGIRLASAIPSPGGVPVAVFVLVMAQHRRRAR